MANDANSTFTENYSFVSQRTPKEPRYCTDPATRANGWAKPVTVTIDNVNQTITEMFICLMFSAEQMTA